VASLPKPSAPGNAYPVSDIGTGFEGLELGVDSMPGALSFLLHELNRHKKTAIMINLENLVFMNQLISLLFLELLKSIKL
jgi:hypothetical protein